QALPLSPFHPDCTPRGAAIVARSVSGVHRVAGAGGRRKGAQTARGPRRRRGPPEIPGPARTGTPCGTLKYGPAGRMFVPRHKNVLGRGRERTGRWGSRRGHSRRSLRHRLLAVLRMLLQILTIARNTFVESIRQPILFVLVVVCG